MGAKLVIVSHHEGQREVPLEQPRITIGRKLGNDLQFNRPEISAIHCAFLHENNEYYVSDLGSTNGTLLNGAKLVAQQRYSLQDGDVITIAPYRITFVLGTDISDTMEETPEDRKRSGTGTILDAGSKVSTGTEEQRQPGPQVEPKQTPAPAPPASTPVEPARPEVLKPTPERPAPTPPAAGKPHSPSVPPQKAVSPVTDYVWLGIGALFLVVAIALVLLILLA